MLIGIFLHFWGLFENVLSIKLWEHKNNKFIYKEFSINIDKSNFPEEFFNNTRNKTSKKIRLLGKINFLEVKHIINSGPKKLRDTIAHNKIYFGINRGAMQTRPGWIKPDPSREETIIIRKALKNNPSVSQDEINSTFVYRYPRA